MFENALVVLRNFNNYMRRYDAHGKQERDRECNQETWQKHVRCALWEADFQVLVCAREECIDTTVVSSWSLSPETLRNSSGSLGTSNAQMTALPKQRRDQSVRSGRRWCQFPGSRPMDQPHRTACLRLQTA
jgi:hypothetical protein